MSEGLAGHELDFYEYVNNSRWLYPQGSTEGTDYSGLNEGLPYWFNGFVPLAYLLDDSRLKGQVHSVAERVLSLQTEDGWIGPENTTERNFWARTPFFLGLTQLAEANASWTPPVLKALSQFFTLANTMLHNNGSGLSDCADGVDCTWGQARIHDMIITVQWMLDNHASSLDTTLWDNMKLFHQYTTIRWEEWYTATTYPEVVEDPTPANVNFSYLHGVNVGQGLKAPAVFWRFLGTDGLLTAGRNAVDWTMKYHGAPSGTILADEIQRDLAPFMGSELCTAVETAYSLSYMAHVFGTSSWADQAELITFNALPVMLTDDMWAHQYMDQPNQPWANNNTQDFDVHAKEHVFTTADSGVATTYGWEPQYPCCSVNHPQGYPKFVTQSWGRLGADGIVHLLLSPSTLTTDVSGHPTTIECVTEYPFSDQLRYKVQAQTPFELYIRIPSSAQASSSSFSIDQGANHSLDLDDNGLHKVQVPSGQTVIDIRLDIPIRTAPRSNNTISVYRGNLLYALEVPSSITSSLPHESGDPTGPGLSNYTSQFPQLRDYYYTNSSTWNIAIDPDTIQYHSVDSSGLSSPVWSQADKLSYLTVQGCEIGWDLYLDATPNWAPEDRTCRSAAKEYRLLPYGATKLHMSELPIVKLD